ncbi:hypothetical protein GQ42DRAFT_179892 [Ramicandelaber brevisporus]|nr:hypothetical protein GQ42DRAFT_179892 [Ramicandelaber brevisporus]
MYVTTPEVHSIATSNTTESVSIPVDNSECSNTMGVDTDRVAPTDYNVFGANAVSTPKSEKLTPTTRNQYSSNGSVVLTEVINLVTTPAELSNKTIYDVQGRLFQLYSNRAYSPLSMGRVNEALTSQHVYRTLDGSFFCENNIMDWGITRKTSNVINGIIQEYIEASLGSVAHKSGGQALSKDGINVSEIAEILRAFLTYASLTPAQTEIIHILGTLGYRLQNKDVILDHHSFTKTLLYYGYIIALCTTDLLTKLNESTRQKSAHMIIVCHSTLPSTFIQLFIGESMHQYIMPVEYQKCYKVEHDKILPGHVDFYKRNYNQQSRTGLSINVPHTVGHWTMLKGDFARLTFISGMCKGCDICNRNKHPTTYSDHNYEKMLSLVPERGIFKLHTDWRLLVLYVILVGAIATAVSLIMIYRNDGVDPGGLTGTIVFIAIASIGFVRELFYPETELRDFLRAKVAISKFSEYCKLKDVCGSCVSALAIKHRADFGPVAVGPYASIAGGKPGPAERGKIFMDKPCNIECFYTAGFALARRIQLVSNNMWLPVDNGKLQVAKMELPSVFEQLISYHGHDYYSASKATDYFIVGMDEHRDHNVASLVHGVATITNDQIIRIEWLPAPVNAVVAR